MLSKARCLFILLTFICLESLPFNTTWGELSSECGASCDCLVLTSPWSKLQSSIGFLACIRKMKMSCLLNVGRVVLGRVFFEASFLWGESSLGKLSFWGRVVLLPSDWHSMRVTRHLPDKQILFDFTLHQQKLDQVQSAKYLGLTITDNLDWGQHVSEISCKATKTMGFLRCNLAPRHTKEVAYKTLVRPQLEYAAPIWNPYHKLQIQEVEKVQRTAARWTCRRWRNTSSVGDMLDVLEWPSLEARREQSSLTFFNKIHSGTVSLDKDKYLTPAPNLQRTRASHDLQYTRYFAYSDALKNSFFPRTIPLWSR